VFFRVKYFFKRLHLQGIVFIVNASVLQNEKPGQNVMLWLCVNLGYNLTCSVLSRQGESRVLIAPTIAMA